MWAVTVESGAPSKESQWAPALAVLPLASYQPCHWMREGNELIQAFSDLHANHALWENEIPALLSQWCCKETFYP